MTQPVALVVGGTSGIGLATARLLLDHGEAVHETGRRAEVIEDLAAREPDIAWHRADAGEAGAMRSLGEHLGTVDHLVLAASGGAGAGRIAELSLDDLRTAFEGKFWPHLVTLQTLLPHLARDGSVTFLSAISARAAMPGTAGLAAVNGALEAMVRPLANELAPVRVNAVSPGVVDTPWWSGMESAARESYFARLGATLPVQHVARPEEIAELVVLAARNANVTGSVFESDGGARLITLD